MHSDIYRSCADKDFCTKSKRIHKEKEKQIYNIFSLYLILQQATVMGTDISVCTDGVPLRHNSAQDSQKNNFLKTMKLTGMVVP